MMTVQDRAGQMKRQLAGGETLLGCFLSLGSAETAEIVGSAGYDFALVDLEHGTGGEREALGQLQALAAAECAAIVRVESADRPRVHRVLDSGAHGVMFPRVESAEEAKAAVNAMRYPPLGGRGLATVTRACAFGTSFRAYLEGAGNLLTIVQIESAAAVERAEEIAAVDGVDVLFVGPFDLTFSMGILCEFDNPKFQTAVARTAEAAVRHGKECGILLPGGHPIEKYAELGYRFIVSSSDAAMLAQTARAAVQGLQEERSRLKGAARL